tara:strand:- start:3860 stop:5254 length:1395 start_codon:yes stop_codon:yes gene_type:complete
MEDYNMAYKFQLGTARLSGSLIQEGDVTAANSKISGSTIGITDATGIAGSGLEANGGSLDLDLRANKGLNVHAEGLEIALANNKGLEFDSGNLAIQLNGNSLQVGETGLSLNAVQVVGAGIAEDSGKIAIDLAATSGLELTGSGDSGELRIKLSGSESGLGYNADGLSVAVSASGGIEIDPNGLQIDLSGSSADCGLVIDNGGLALNSTIGGNKTFSDNVTISGNLIVNGTTVQVDSSTINITGSLQFEGVSNNGNETTFAVVDPTADTTISLPALNAATDYGVAVLKGSLSAAEGVVTPAEFLVLDGNSTLNTGITVSDDADGFLMNDGGVMKHIRADNLKTYFQTGVTADSADTTEGFAYNEYDATSSVAYNPNGVTGFLVASGSSASNALSASVNTTINLSGSWNNGEVLYIKAPSNASVFNLTIRASGSDEIDGESEVVLESDYAAITLLRCHNSRWSIV